MSEREVIAKGLFLRRQKYTGAEPNAAKAMWDSLEPTMRLLWLQEADFTIADLRRGGYKIAEKARERAK